MAQYGDHTNADTHQQGLKLDTHLDRQHSSSPFAVAANDQHRTHRPSYNFAHTSQDTIRPTATPPIEIPGQHDENSPATDNNASSNDADSYAERFLRERKPSISFNNEVTTDTGHRHSIVDPARDHVSRGSRGRSLGQILAEPRASRAHSESESTHYDPRTGQHLPQYSNSPPKEEARVGEARFPLLQDTVDALARQSVHRSQPMSMISDATMSPVEEAILTPSDEAYYPTSPVNIASSFNRQFSTSYESHRPKNQRKASERWRNGEAAPDFFARAGSLKKSETRRSTYRDPLSATRSPRSAASSFLRGFSMSSSNEDSAPPPVDAEGATVGEDYVLGKQIGYGGFSIIREVKQMSAQTGRQRTLAVKIVRKQIDGKSKADNDTAQAEFEHEVDLWRLLNHPHILTLEAVYELKEATFCFVPLNIGGTLFDAVNSNREGLPVTHAVSYAYQLASALRYLHHDAHVVHRDIKLENCLVDTTRCIGPDEPGHLRLCDFGLAEWITSDGDSNASGSVASDAGTDQDRPLNKYFGPSDSSTSAFAGGSLEYAAPEILRLASGPSGTVHVGDTPPDKSAISPSIDIWAMGVCLFAMLVGRRPFQDSFQPRVVMAILAGNWDKNALKEKADDQAYRVVKSCLRQNPLKRASIGEIIASPWFEEMRAKDEGSDVDSDSTRARGWRL